MEIHMFRFTCITRAIQAFARSIQRQIAIVRREYIVEQYVRSGAVFGEALSHLYMGECVGFHGMKERWAKLEQLYADLGYRTIPVEDFVEYGGYGKAIDHKVRVKRSEGEAPVLHAVTFQERYAQGILPELDVPHQGEPTLRTCETDPKDKKKKTCDGTQSCKNDGKPKK